MKLSERFDSFTVIELQRAIEMRERTIVKMESEIRALRKLAKSKITGLPYPGIPTRQDRPSKKEKVHG